MFGRLARPGAGVHRASARRLPDPYAADVDWVAVAASLEAGQSSSRVEVSPVPRWRQDAQPFGTRDHQRAIRELRELWPVGTLSYGQPLLPAVLMRHPPTVSDQLPVAVVTPAGQVGVLCQSLSVRFRPWVDELARAGRVLAARVYVIADPERPRALAVKVVLPNVRSQRSPAPMPYADRLQPARATSGVEHLDMPLQRGTLVHRGRRSRPANHGCCHCCLMA